MRIETTLTETCVFNLRERSDTLHFGEALGRHLEAGDVLALVGDLGTGKTTLTQAIAKGMGIRSLVTSPTFTLLHEYAGHPPLFHCDPYRLETPDALLDFGFEEYFERGGVVVVEWANRVAALLPPGRLTLTLEMQAEGKGTEPARRLTIQATGMRPANGEPYAALLRSVVSLPEIAPLLEREYSQ